MAKRATRGPGAKPMWLRLGGLLGLFVVLYGLMVLTGTNTPKLGLDLQGGTSVTLTPRLLAGGGRPSVGSIDKAVDIIRQRVNGLGVAEADVRRAGDRIEITVPGRGREQVVDLVGQTAQLNFREVSQQAAATTTTTPTTAPTATPTSAAPSSKAPSSTATPAPSASATPSATTTPKAAGRLPIGAAVSSELGPAAVSAAAPVGTPAPATSSVAATPSAAATPAAAATPSPSTSSSTSATTSAADTPPASVLAAYASLSCAATNTTKGSVSTDLPQDWVAACDKSGQVKYLLKPAVVVGTDVSGATATIPQTTGGTGQWTVDVQFTGPGQAKFTNLTAATTGKQVAIVLDGVVQSAPTINERISGSAEISGSFTEAEADDLANILKYGALPLAFDKSQAESISATLGQSSLNAGLIAGGIGLILVVIYCFLYYRALGFITIASLVVSGGLVYACVCLLGQAIGFTLSLAGVAGFIVAVGITADSFVVFYERVKDEVRAGRTVRTSVDRAWVRARATIISADTVSLLAAVALYLLSIGSVRGFAFTLGLSTLLDLVVVFFFTRPLVTLLVRLPFFSTGRFSGLSSPTRGPAGSSDDGPVVPTTRTRLTKRTGVTSSTVGSAAVRRGEV